MQYFVLCSQVWYCESMVTKFEGVGDDECVGLALEHVVAAVVGEGRADVEPVVTAEVP